MEILQMMQKKLLKIFREKQKKWLQISNPNHIETEEENIIIDNVEFEINEDNKE